MGMITFEQIHKKLCEAIETSSISKSEIARRLGISPSNISKYLHANLFPDIDTFANLCVILDVSADEILGIKK